MCQHDPQQASRELAYFPDPAPVSAKAAASAAQHAARKAASAAAQANGGRAVHVDREFMEQWARATDPIPTADHARLPRGTTLPEPAGALPTGVARALAAARVVEFCIWGDRGEDSLHDAVTLASGSGVAGVVSLALNSWSPQTAGNFAQIVIKIAQLPPTLVPQADWNKYFSAAPSVLVRNAVLSSARVVLSALNINGAFLAGAAKKAKLEEQQAGLAAVLDAATAAGATTAKVATVQPSGPLEGVGVLHAIGACVMLLVRRDNPRWEAAAHNAALACARVAGASPDMMQFVREHAFPLLENYRGTKNKAQVR